MKIYKKKCEICEKEFKIYRGITKCSNIPMPIRNNKTFERKYSDGGVLWAGGSFCNECFCELTKYNPIKILDTQTFDNDFLIKLRNNQKAIKKIMKKRESERKIQEKIKMKVHKRKENRCLSAEEVLCGRWIQYTNSSYQWKDVTCKDCKKARKKLSRK